MYKGITNKAVKRNALTAVTRARPAYKQMRRAPRDTSRGRKKGAWREPIGTHFGLSSRHLGTNWLELPAAKIDPIVISQPERVKTIHHDVGCRAQGADAGHDGRGRSASPGV